MTGDKSWQGHQDDNNNFITRTPPGGQQGIGEGFEDIAPTGGSTVSHDYTDDISFDESPAADSGGWGDDYASEMIAEGGRVGYNRGRVVNPGGYSGNTYSDFLADKTVIPHPDDKSWRDVFYRWLDSRKAQGGLIGYFDGGIAGLL
jgi:hypothetical protein